MSFKLRYLPLLALPLLASCKKEVDRIVVQDRQYSWATVHQFPGLGNVFLGMGKGPDGLYLQQPGSFLTVEQGQSEVVYQQYFPPISSDVNVRLPIGSNFFVTYHDSLVTIIPNKHAVTGQYYRDIHLKRLDRQAQQVQPGIYAYFKMGAINANSYLLFGYLSTNLYFDNQMHLVLAQVPPFNPGDLTPSPLATRVITIPIVGYPATPSYPTLITAIDNYFLVDCGNQGVYRIEQTGSYRQVLSGQRYSIESFYKWHGRVYAHTGDRRIGFSDDDGLTWQFAMGAPSNFRFNTFHPIGDSLVGIYHGLGSNFLFTLKWTNQSYRVRLLKNDGLENLDLNGLETWRDTVYLATSGGLFKKSVSSFFESKPN